MLDFLSALVLLAAGLILRALRPGSPTEWSETANVAWLSLALTGGLLLAIRIPDPDAGKGRRPAIILGHVAGWPRFLAGLYLIFSAFIDTKPYMTYHAYSENRLWARIALQIALPGESMLAACYAAVGLIACVAAMLTALRHDRDGILMLVILFLGLLGMFLSPELQ